MARAESTQIMDFLPVEERHFTAFLSLVAFSTPAVRLLDPFAGKGGIDLLDVDLDVDTGTGLITNGLERGAIEFP